MFGCHNCGYVPAPGTPFEKTPCASCKTGKNPPPVAYFKDDPGTFDRMQVPHPSMVGNGEQDQEAGAEYDFYGGERMIPVNQLLKALAQSVRMLVNLKEHHPQTYKILDAKMQDPNLSYADLAERFSCKKQNVQYHLKRAVMLCPE